MDSRSEAKATGVTRSFASSTDISGITIHALLGDAKTGDVNLKPIANTISENDGTFKFNSPINKEIVLDFIHWFYHPTVKCGIEIPEAGIKDSDPLKTLAIQIPDWISIYIFSLLMGTPPSKEGYMTGVCATATEANTTLRDFPHGLEGVKVELIFDDPKIQTAWELEQSHDVMSRAKNKKINNITTSLAALSGLVALYSTKERIKEIISRLLFAIAIGLATKTISALTALRFFKAAVSTFNWGAWKKFYLEGYTDPSQEDLLLTSEDGGVFFNLRNINLPANGARFKLTASKVGYNFKPVFGYAFKNKLAIFTHPQTIRADPTPQDLPTVQPGEIEEKGRPIRLIKSLSLGSGLTLGAFLQGQSVLKSLAAGAITATFALYCLEGFYKKTLNPITIFGAPILKSREGISPKPIPGDALLNPNYFRTPNSG